MLLNRKCPVCRNDTGGYLKKIEFILPEDYHLPSEYNVVVCDKCGFVFADTIASLEDYDRYYVSFNNYVPDNKNSEDMVHNITFNYFYKILKKYDNSKKNYIDLGAGDGSFAIRINDSNIGFKSISGLDPSYNCKKRLIKHNIGYINGSIYNLGNIERKFEVISVFSVLEHLLNPLEAIREIDKILNQDRGQIMINVPDCSFMEDNDTPLANNFNQEHINYFSLQSLDNLFKNINMKRVFSETLFIEYENNKSKEALLLALYEKDNTTEKDFVKDVKTVESIKNYLKKQDNFFLDINKKIQNFVNENIEVLVWGGGAYTFNLLSNTDLKKCNIKYFVDNNKNKIGTNIQGIEIVSPNSIIKTNYPIIISSMLNSQKILEQINEIKLENEIIIL
ncbi:hypothetical protein HMPREF9628_01105 [Peptoanaerobacter stomatis]|uniref:C-methyltransferase domain-containing protein n=1 Tax=Peptoanaerobacter stomatis TaxID=796937 RepID=G9XAT8_9FIRM|nr:class I SAM-dependent methyltransferase [Peptoanaerobacter stomatis]EHL19932.1 hypothetical protein HMPREF9628_01105 [Peptoanaerobacter stomatis]